MDKYHQEKLKLLQSHCHRHGMNISLCKCLEPFYRKVFWYGNRDMFWVLDGDGIMGLNCLCVLLSIYYNWFMKFWPCIIHIIFISRIVTHGVSSDKLIGNHDMNEIWFIGIGDSLRAWFLWTGPVLVQFFQPRSMSSIFDTVLTSGW